MSELIQASIVEKATASPERQSTIEYSTEEVGRLKEAVEQFMVANEIDPSNTLFAGYTVEQVQTDEHYTEDGTKIHYFGDLGSMSPPETFKGDEEEKEERWMVNPLKYAIQGHRLGIYDKAKLDALTGGTINEDFDDVEYGTYTYSLDHADIEAAKVAEMHF